jgi:hypothetical protein
MRRVRTAFDRIDGSENCGTAKTRNCKTRWGDWQDWQDEHISGESLCGTDDKHPRSKKHGNCGNYVSTGCTGWTG